MSAEKNSVSLEAILSIVDDHIRNEKELKDKWSTDPKRENVFRHGIDVLQLLRRALLEKC